MKRNSQSSIEKLTQEVTKITKSKESYKDDRFWRPEQDKAGNGYAVIRFLPTLEGEDVPWARLFSHGFKGPGGWYIENSRTTLGDKDPVSEMNTQLWNSGLESDKEIARARKRRLNYISNIMVVSDPANPQNEGKVFLYKFGKKIFDKINEAMQPEFADEEAINPFDFWTGANFRLKVRKVAGFVNYDKSEFESPSALLDGDDEKLEELWKTQYPLKEFTDATNFKSYEQLKAKLDSVLSGGGGLMKSAEEVETTFDTDISKTDSNSDSSDHSDENEDDALSYFEKLANE
tara:strand:- start:793 stop:1662 length:870 start_codon:yes stop_codon:yes gene_type:complete